MPTIPHLRPSLLTCRPQPGILVFPWILNPPSCSAAHQQPSPTPGSQFSPDQLSQLHELIAETVGSQHSGPGEGPGLLADVPLLSPASPLNVMAITTTEQNLNCVNLPNVIQDGGLSLSQFVPSLPQASQGPGQQIVLDEHDPTLPPPPEKLHSKISKCCLTLHLKASKTEPIPAGLFAIVCPISSFCLRRVSPEEVPCSASNQQDVSTVRLPIWQLSHQGFSHHYHPHPPSTAWYFVRALCIPQHIHISS